MKNLLFTIVTIIIISIIVFPLVKMTGDYYLHDDTKNERKHPFIILDTKEPVKPEDTLYVIAVRNDSVWLYKPSQLILEFHEPQ